MNKTPHKRLLNAVTLGVLIGLGYLPAGNAKLTQATLSFTSGEGSKPVVQSQLGEVRVGEQFTTGANEVREVLLTDGTVLTLGINSYVVVEDYAYDRERRTGQLSLRIESGLVRIVGGVLNNTHSIRIITPTAELTLDNAAATVDVSGGKTRVNLLYGKSLAMTSGGVTESLVKPGFELVSVEKTSPPEGPSLQDGKMVLADMAALETLQLQREGDEGGSATSADRKSALDKDINAIVTEDQPVGQLASSDSGDNSPPSSNDPAPPVTPLPPVTPPPPAVTETATLGVGSGLAIADPAALSGDGVLAKDAPVTNTNGDFYEGNFVEIPNTTFRRFQTEQGGLLQSAEVYDNPDNLGGSHVPGQSTYLFAAAPSPFGFYYSSGENLLVNSQGERVIQAGESVPDSEVRGVYLDRLDQTAVDTLFDSPRDAIFIGRPDDVGTVGDYTDERADSSSDLQIPVRVTFSADDGSVITDLFTVVDEDITETERYIELGTDLRVGDTSITREYIGKQTPQSVVGEMGGDETNTTNVDGDISIDNSGARSVSGLAFFPGYSLEKIHELTADFDTGELKMSTAVQNVTANNATNGAFYAFDFKPDPTESNVGERYFVFGGIAPADNISGRLPGTGAIGDGFQAVRHDIRDGLTPDPSGTSGFIPGSALRRDATLPVDSANAYDSGLVLTSTNQSGAANAFLKVDFALDGGGASQTSSVSVATGVAGDASTGLSGGMVGSAQLDARATATHLQSGVYSQPETTADAATHWFGGNQYSDGTSSLEGKIGYVVLGTDNPATVGDIEFASEQVLGSAENVEYEYLRLASRGVNNDGGSAPLAVQPGSRSTQAHAAGYAAGLVQSVDGTTAALYALNSATDGSSVKLDTDAATNRVKAGFTLVGKSIDASPAAPTSQVAIAFGDDSNAELSAYVEDDSFAARSSNATFDGSNAVGGEAALVAGAALRDGLPEEMRSQVPDYQYVKWGFFFGDLAVTESRRDHMHLGSWVAAERIPDPSELRLQGAATHVGHVAGNVYGGGSSYTAVGSYQNAWNFDQRAGAVNMNFDGTQYTGTTQLAEGAVTFNGSVAATGRTGALEGALVGVRTDGLPQGEIGQFSIQETPGDALYRATGTFAAENSN